MTKEQSTNYLEFSISVIIPVMNDWDNLHQVLQELDCQILKPREIIVVDSSSDNVIKNSLSKFNTNISIKYLRAGKAFFADRFFIKYFKFFLRDKSLAGRAYPY